MSQSDRRFVHLCECGETLTRETKKDVLFCPSCSEKIEPKGVTTVYRYTVVILVDGEVNSKHIQGITSKD